MSECELQANGNARRPICHENTTRTAAFYNAVFVEFPRMSYVWPAAITAERDIYAERFTTPRVVWTDLKVLRNLAASSILFTSLSSGAVMQRHVCHSLDAPTERKSDSRTDKNTVKNHGAIRPLPSFPLPGEGGSGGSSSFMP